MSQNSSRPECHRQRSSGCEIRDRRNSPEDGPENLKNRQISTGIQFSIETRPFPIFYSLPRYRNRPRKKPGCTSFASPPFLERQYYSKTSVFSCLMFSTFDIQKNTGTGPEQSDILRRECMRQYVATLQWQEWVGDGDKEVTRGRDNVRDPASRPYHSFTSPAHVRGYVPLLGGSL